MSEGDKKHPSHTTRGSDASTYDEVCIDCGATDVAGGGWGNLAEPCPKAQKESSRSACGVVTYDVVVECPHCKRHLALTQAPYNNEESEYSHAEDELGLALFGTISEPVKWENLEIEYKCCHCKKNFTLTGLEI